MKVGPWWNFFGIFLKLELEAFFVEVVIW